MNNEQNKDAIISIVEKGGQKWVRVQALGEDFSIDLHDLKDDKGEIMKNCDYDTIMERLKKIGLDTFSRKQLFIIAIYINEINKAMKEAGGERFAADWYVSKELWAPVGSCADYHAPDSWYFTGTNGCVTYSYRYDSFFRCRPCLALPFPS